ncbi:DUF3253 domain-containing protein [Sphingomonas sp. PB4P5]|uniref:DUF3253 domain-containing protein n=1 Tax=Parasphingomonas puruogangriensis TaxID=3096155 RepID=UPI002FC9F467
MGTAEPSARDATLALLSCRAHGATICPSEVARALAAPPQTGAPGTNWREFMPIVHAAVDELVAEGLVRLSWKGAPLAARAGPYRIGQITAPV